MSSLFDKLQSELEDREEEGGITALDLLDLPSELRKIMRFMLRQVESSRTDLTDHIKTWEKEKLSDSDLDKSLEALVKQGWLLRLGEEGKWRYKVNLRRKKGSEIAASLFDKLDDRIEKQARKFPDIKPKPKEDES